MSINWVMLSPSDGFTPLPREQRLYTSPPRTSLTLRSPAKYPAAAFSISSSTGQIHLTNRRIVYLPESPTPQLQSFAAPLLNLHDTHVTAPLFGPNVCAALVQPVPNGGIPPRHPALELKLTFKDGGAYDFHTAFVRVRERLQQAVEVARETGQAGAAGAVGAPVSGVDMDAVHLDELPAYEESTGTTRVAPVQLAVVQTAVATTTQPSQVTNQAGQAQAEHPPGYATAPGQGTSQTPDEPPPGYAQVQMESVAEFLDRDERLRST